MHKVKVKAKAANKPIAYLENTLSDQTLKITDMEDRMRRNNIHLVGFPGWLNEHMAPETFTNMFAIERAHRVLVRAPPMERFLAL